MMGWIRSLQRHVQAALLFGGISVLSMFLAAAILVAGSDGASEDASPSTSMTERGLQLYVDKGCIRCHGHRRVQEQVEGLQSFGTDRSQSYGAGQELTDYSGDPEFLRNWLRDPASVRPDTTMPDLRLEDGEIDALIAFLNWNEDDS